MSDLTPEELSAILERLQIARKLSPDDSLVRDTETLIISALAAWEADRKRLEMVERSAHEFIYQAESVDWKVIVPPLGKGESSLDEAYKDLKSALAAIKAIEHERTIRSPS
jgi:hypothetical protein